MIIVDRAASLTVVLALAAMTIGCGSGNSARTPAPSATTVVSATPLTTSPNAPLPTSALRVTPPAAETPTPPQTAPPPPTPTPPTIPTSPPPPPDTPTPEPPPTPTPEPICGEAASLSLTSASPVGRTFHAGDQLRLDIAYDAPSCTGAGATLYGFARTGTPIYTYWCIDHAKQISPGRCSPKHLEEALSIDAVRLSASNGVVTLIGIPGPFPPTTTEQLGADPPIEGFTPCSLHIVLDDGRFGGTAFVRDIGAYIPGEPCRDAE